MKHLFAIKTIIPLRDPADMANLTGRIHNPVYKPTHLIVPDYTADLSSPTQTIGLERFCDTIRAYWILSDGKYWRVVSGPWPRAANPWMAHPDPYKAINPGDDMLFVSHHRDLMPDPKLENDLKPDPKALGIL
jgi:hypothetical protein